MCKNGHEVAFPAFVKEDAIATGSPDKAGPKEYSWKVVDFTDMPALLHHKKVERYWVTAYVPLCPVCGARL